MKMKVEAKNNQVEIKNVSVCDISDFVMLFVYNGADHTMVTMDIAKAEDLLAKLNTSIKQAKKQERHHNKLGIKRDDNFNIVFN